MLSPSIKDGFFYHMVREDEKRTLTPVERSDLVNDHFLLLRC